MFARTLAFALDALYPARCPGCNGAADPKEPGGWCRVCAVSVLSLDDACETGGLFATARSAVAYGGSVRDAILRFKHGRRRDLARPLGALLAVPLAATLAGVRRAVLVPVPLHPRRLRARGFNQSLELIRFAAPSREARILPDLLVRRFDTPDMGHLGVAERRARVHGVFGVRKPALISGKTVVLVDDVMTTGATVSECARALLASGACAVHVVCLARTLA